jgi:hypothetical protein
MLMNRWLEHEFERAHPKGGLPGLTMEQRWRAATELALLLWRRAERSINILEVPRELLHQVTQLAKHELDSGSATHQIGSGTLLVRDEENNFSFIHQSVLEWFVARTVAEAIRQQEPAVAFEVRAGSALMLDFVWGLAGREQAEQWARRVLASQPTGPLRENAVQLLQRLGVTLQDSSSSR